MLTAVMPKGVETDDTNPVHRGPPTGNPGMQAPTISNQRSTFKRAIRPDLLLPARRPSRPSVTTQRTMGGQPRKKLPDVRSREVLKVDAAGMRADLRALAKGS